MFECPHKSILCFAQSCKFINNLETVFFHFIKCLFYLLYCALCKSLCNVSVSTHDCNLIKSQRSILVFKYYHENLLSNHFQKDVVLRNHLYIEIFEDRKKIINDMFISVALSNPLLTNVSTKRIFQRQHGVVNLSSSNTYTNTD